LDLGRERHPVPEVLHLSVHWRPHVSAARHRAVWVRSFRWTFRAASAGVIQLSRTQLEALVSDKGASGTTFTRTSSCPAVRTNRRKRASNCCWCPTFSPFSAENIGAAKFLYRPETPDCFWPIRSTCEPEGDFSALRAAVAGWARSWGVHPPAPQMRCRPAPASSRRSQTSARCGVAGSTAGVHLADLRRGAHPLPEVHRQGGRRALRLRGDRQRGAILDRAERQKHEDATPPVGGEDNPF
jgi:hypothetical protein